MSELDFARAQMELSLGFHIVFSSLGIGMPLLLCVAEALSLRNGADHYRALAKRWSKATALLFVVGAVSGTALSFELGLLWPKFMLRAGAILGPAFTLEGYAFFVEAIFLGLYLYGWDRLSPRAHWWTSVPLAASGLASGALVVAANAWMQHPVLAESKGDTLFAADAWAVFRTPMWIPMAIHSSLASYAAVGFAVAGVYAWARLRGRGDGHTDAALRLAMAMATVATVLQAVSGDRLAKEVARYEPVKLAAMEALYETERDAAILIGGIPDRDAEVVRYGMRVPHGLSFLAKGDLHTAVTGLREFPKSERPNELLVHLAFQVMVGCAAALVVVCAIYWLAHRRGQAHSRWVMRAVVLASPLGMLAVEAGWGVSELGRQPWIVHGIMRTSEAVTPVRGVAASFVAFAFLYALLAVVLVSLLRNLSRGGHRA